MIKIRRNENCTGCHACQNICPRNCITMKNDTEGFWYPKVNIEKCNNCGLCENVCPIINKKEENNSPKAFACYNKNENANTSSSGGIFTLIAEEVLGNGGVVFGGNLIPICST